MARAKTSYTIKTTEVVEKLAVATVKGNTDLTPIVINFLADLGVPIDTNAVIERVNDIEQYRELFESQGKSK